MTMPTITVIGSVNLDIVARAGKLPAPGETVTDAELHSFPGGKGANQALAAQCLGADVTLIARVGDDASADAALALLREGGVDLSNCSAVAGKATGTALIAVAPSGENQIVVAPGANRSLTPGDFAVPASDALICQLEVPVDTVAWVAQNYDGFFCINLAPAMRIDVAVLQRADLVVVNETESAWYGATLAACSGIVATTRGGGVATLEKDGELLAEASPPAVEAVDTTGAGDAFHGGFAAGLAHNRSWEYLLRFASAVAAITCTRMGARIGLPTKDEVDQFLANHKL